MTRKISSLLRMVGIVMNTLPKCKLFFGLDRGLLQWGSDVVRQWLHVETLLCLPWARKGTTRILVFTIQSGFIFWIRYVFQKSRDRILPEQCTYLWISSPVWCHKQYHHHAQTCTDAQTVFLTTSSVGLSPRNYCTQGNEATGFIWCANCLSVPATDACKISVYKEKEDFGLLVLEIAVMTCWLHHFKFWQDRHKNRTSWQSHTMPLMLESQSEEKEGCRLDLETGSLSSRFHLFPILLLRD